MQMGHARLPAPRRRCDTVLGAGACLTLETRCLPWPSLPASAGCPALIPAGRCSDSSEPVVLLVAGGQTIPLAHAPSLKIGQTAPHTLGELPELLVSEDSDETRRRDARFVKIAPGIRQGADHQVRGLIIEVREKGIGRLSAQAVLL